MTTITIPKTIEAAKAVLDGLGALLTAKQWERAAIVYAFTEEGTNGRPAKPRNTERFSPVAFAGLGITGLASDNTVRAYRKAWQSAMEKGAPDITPGDVISVPDLPWKDVFGEATPVVQERVARAYIAKNPQVVAEAMKAVPAVAEAAVKAVVDDHDLAEKHERMSNSKRWTGQTVDKGPHVPVTTVPDFSQEKKVQAAIMVLHHALLDEQAGTFTIDPALGLMLSVLKLNLQKRDDAIASARPAVFKEIDEFLKAARA